MSDIIQKIELCKFFIGVNGRIIDIPLLKDIKLHEVNLPQRFLNVLKYYIDQINKINNINDLLNINYFDLLCIKNCGYNSIKKVRTIILNYVNELTKKYDLDENNIGFKKLILQNVSSVENHITNTFFFIGNKGIKIESEYLSSITLDQLDFSIRFQHSLSNLKTINNLCDLLNTDYIIFLLLPNNGEKTINDAREKIRNFLKNEEKKEKKTDNENTFFDDRIINHIKKYIKKSSVDHERNMEIFLMYLSNKYTLQQIAEKFKLTRERVRQITDKIYRGIKKNLNEFIFIIKAMNNYGIFFKLDEFINYLIVINLLKEKNKQLTINFIKEFIIGKVINEEFGYLITINSKLIKTSLLKINETIINIFNNIRNELSITELKKELSKHIDDTLIQDLRVDKNILEYLSLKFEDFYIVDDMVYDKIMYNIIYGKNLRDVIYWSLKYLEEPIHFTQLARFIRDNNKYYSEITDQRIHSCLIRYRFCHDIDRGTYALIESNIPKHISAGEAIINLLKEKGPLLESEIKKLLIDKYTSWNISLALTNNIHKLIKIGNNLYDVKR
jgi:hypothetical protein